MPEAQPAEADRPGCLVLVVGPSGSGKDSLIADARTTLSGDPRFHFPQRVITREPDATEGHEPVSEAEFESRLETGRFLLHWRAHGLSYAIPAETADYLARGACVIANVSRTIIAEACRAFPNVRVVHVTANPEVLRGRLESRQREDPADRNARLRRAPDMDVPPECHADEIANNGQLVEAAERFNALISGYAESATRE